MNPDRLFVKCVRDKTRTHLKKADKCYITGRTTDLEIHHLYTLSSLVNEFLQDRVITSENKLELRNEFIELYFDKIQIQYILSKEIHNRLHYLFGTCYPNHVVPKVQAWIEKKRQDYGWNN